MCEELRSKLTQKLAFIGAGRIAQAWIDCLVQKGAIGSEDWIACDVDNNRLEHVRKSFGHKWVTDDPVEAARFGKYIVIATPPGEVMPLLARIRAFLSPDHVVISLAAGIPISILEATLQEIPSVRVMPNTPALVGEAMNLVVFGQTVTAATRAEIEKLLEVLGVWFVVDDKLMEYWCALCSVGPTYIFPIVEALSSAAAARGIPMKEAIDAVSQVLVGVGCLIQATDKTIPELKQMIGLHTLREEEAKKLFTDAYNDAVTKLEGVARRVAA